MLIKKTMKSRIERISIPTPFSLGTVNTYLLINDAVSLVDVGPNTEKAWAALQEGVRQHGMTLRDVDHIFLTHHHVDHSGLAWRVQEASSALLYCHPLSEGHLSLKEYVDYTNDYFFRFYLENGLPVQEAKRAIRVNRLQARYGKPVVISGWLQEGQRLPGHEEWVICHFPGHSQDLLCFYHPIKKWFLSSDHLMSHFSTHPFLEAPHPGKNRAKALLQYRQSLERCLELDIQLVLPGHGECFTNVRELIQEQFAKHDSEAAYILSFLHNSSKNVFELAGEMFSDRMPSDLWEAVSEIIGYLDLLEERGLIETEKKDGVDYFRAVTQNNDIKVIRNEKTTQPSR